MSIPAPYSEVYLAGDGTTTVFAFGTNFKPISAGLVKCSVYLQDGYEVIPTYTVDMEGKSITISALTLPDSTVLTAPPAGSTVRIYRDMPEEQDITASQLQAFTAKQLEVALDAIVAMIQEVSYTTDHKTVRLTEPQRDIVLQELSQLDDNHLLYWDSDNSKLVVTSFPQQDVVQCVNGLYFRLQTDPDLHTPYLQWSTDNSNWNSINIDAARALAQGAYALAGDAYTLAYATRGELNTHKGDHSNPHETSLANLIDTNVAGATGGQFLRYNGINWVPVSSSATVYWGDILGNLNDQADLMAEFNKKLNLSGGTLTGDLAFQYSTSYPVLRIIQSGQNTNHLRFINNSYASQSISFDLSQAAIHPLVTGRGHLGTSNIHFGDAYIDKVYTGVVNNGGNLTVPANTTGTLATTADVELAANSGSQLYSTGVWYAKMYAATTVPTGAQYDGTNYADFSQVDADNNPVIKIYTGASGAWTLTDTITPPAEYNGYIWVTSKIWDIAEQTGQQGGEVLWDHTHRTFTPYPRIIDVDLTNYLQNTATGTNSLTILGDATATSTALNIGPYSTAEGSYSLAIGPGSGSAHRVRATHANAIAIGYDALALAIDAIQLGAGQGTTQGRFKVWNHTMLDKTTGKIPIARLGDDTSMTQGNVLTLDSNGAAVWQAPSGGGSAGQSIDAEIYGYVTVSGNDISNFSTGDYVRIPGVFQFKDASSFEIVGAFTTNANSGSQMILCPTNGWLVYMMSGIRIMNSLTDGQQLLHVTIWPDKTTTLTSQSFRGTTNLAANTKYYIKLTYDGTDYKLYLSTDGVNYALEASDTATYLPETNTNGYYLGPRPDSTGTMIAILHMDTWSIKKDAVTVWTGVDAPGLHQRAESSHEVIAFQMPTANNNYTWYRKYADGWVEQGGNVTATSDASYNVALPVTMANNKYTVFVTRDNGSQDHGEGSINARWCEVWGRTTSSFYTWGVYGDSTDFSWQVSGMAQV